MSNERQQSGRGIQSNRHLREWNNNLTLELRTRYILDCKHQQERSQLSLEESNADQQAELQTQQLQEVYELDHQNSEIRITLQKRHLQEKANFNRDLGL